jgi:hypothetical protein
MYGDVVQALRMCGVSRHRRSGGMTPEFAQDRRVSICTITPHVCFLAVNGSPKSQAHDHTLSRLRNPCALRFPRSCRVHISFPLFILVLQTHDVFYQVLSCRQVYFVKVTIKALFPFSKKFGYSSRSTRVMCSAKDTTMVFQLDRERLLLRNSLNKLNCST